MRTCEFCGNCDPDMLSDEEHDRGYFGVCIVTGDAKRANDDVCRDNVVLTPGERRERAAAKAGRVA